MKANAIVYCSNTGHTRQYAEILSQKTGLTAYPIDDAVKNLKHGEKVIFLGWLMAGSVKGYKKAKRYFDIALTVGVGMKIPNEKLRAKLANQNGIKYKDFYVLLGGFDITKLCGMNKLIMSVLSSTIKSKLSKKESLTQDEQITYEMVTNGKNCVDEKNLEPIIIALD